MSLNLNPSLNAFGYNITCFGMQDGYIDLTIYDGVGPFTISWSNHQTTEDITGLPAGYYSVSVYDQGNGTHANAAITLTEPEPIFTSVHLFSSTYPNGYNVSCSSCYDGSIATSVESGVSPFLFEWNDGVTTQDRASIHAGVYEVTVTGANGCAVSEQIILTAPEREDWTAFGNSGSNPSIHFLGTIDNKDLVFKTNSSERLRIKGNGEIKFTDFSSGAGMLYVDDNGILHSGKTLAPCNGTILPIWQSLNPNTIFTCAPNVVGIGTYSIPSGMRLAVSGQSYFNGNTGMGLTALGNIRLAINGSMAIGSSGFLNSITSPLTNGLLIEGKVGIGSPSSFPGNYSLYVTGGILAEKVKVAINGSSAWADHVFHPDYKLKTFNELENFIIKNNHLPNIPSANEIVHEGMDVATMISKLLEKNEELTLYIINLNNRLEKLEASKN